MLIKHSAVRVTNSLLSRVDAEIGRKSDADKMRRTGSLSRKPPHETPALPEGARSYLQADNPRLKELKQKYLALRCAGPDHSHRSDECVSSEIDLQFFRGDNAYLYQLRDGNAEVNYLLTTYYIQKIDWLGLLSVLEEDGLFSIHIYNFNDELTISRDLLDSIVEIYFLEDTLRISTLPHVCILDIGAGYGRLAYGIVKALPGIDKVFCADDVRESVFLAECYLHFRGVDAKAIAIPLYQMKDILASNPVDIATNVHSFSECTLASVSWWLGILRKYKVRYLMIVPNDGEKLLSRETDGRRLDFLPLINARGYRIVAKRSKYEDSSLQEYGVSPTYHYLFELCAGR